jgi:hypothetical protein
VGVEESDGVRYVYWNCPSLFINDFCSKWIDVNNNNQKFGNKNDWTIFPAKFISASKFFENKLAEQMELKRG